MQTNCTVSPTASREEFHPFIFVPYDTGPVFSFYEQHGPRLRFTILGLDDPIRGGFNLQGPLTSNPVREVDCSHTA